MLRAMNGMRSAIAALAAGSAAALLFTAALADGGVFGPLELRGKERHDLIETATEFHGQFERRSLLYNDEAALDLIRRVGYDLAPEPTDDYFKYEFYLIRDPSPNAFAMPNGRIYVHTGMLARLEDSSQLAALMGHEISHVAGHHSIVQYRIKAGQVLDWVFTGGLVSLFSQLRFSRDLEQEADDRAPVMMLDSPYDPHAVPELMALLNEDFEGVRPRVATVWTTHPDPVDRLVKSLVIVGAMPERERDRSDFDAVVYPLRAMTVRDYISDDFPYTAIATAQSFIERYPDNLEFQVLLGDAWRQLGARDEFAPDDFTNKDKRKNLRQRALRTRVERTDKLLETPEGQAAYEANLARAEATYRSVIDRDPDYAPAYRGLGEVYEALDRPRDAGRAYLEYVRQAPNADDRTVIMTRLTAIRDRLAEENANGSD
jgi:predicted Zn-dependent protease